ncbi:MAG TPA: hypothetical protein ENK78_08885 [Thiothrix sp.]|nr:hypothetical protein [Thiothrix sp.]
MQLTFRHIRILILTLILIYVASDYYWGVQRTTSWQAPLNVVIYPINGDGSAASATMIQQLSVDDFAEVNDFLVKQAEYYGLILNQPLIFHLSQELNEKPPTLPKQESIPNAIVWSLQMRWWAWKIHTFFESGIDSQIRPDVRLFVEYHREDSAEAYHSVGLQKGRLGIVKNYANRALIGRNNMILTHEFLHTVGAMDKYFSDNLLPIFPVGYADPYDNPRYPQTRAELMGGRIAVNESTAYVPESLELCMIGETTAKEIGWLRAIAKQRKENPLTTQVVAQ